MNNQANWKKQGAGNKEIKRAHSNFTQMFTTLVALVVVYFKQVK